MKQPPEKLALYFGCIRSAGHFVWLDEWRSTLDPQEKVPGFPWRIEHLDTTLLKNRKAPDHEDGRVHWTCGGRPDFWFAFFWWDNSIDSRPGSNSGFYVRWPAPGGQAAAVVEEVFAFACARWPGVVARQHHPLVLVI